MVNARRKKLHSLGPFFLRSISLRTILKNMRVRLTILLLCCFIGVLAASAQDAETALKQFEGKTLILRHPLQSDSQRYDAEGNVLKGGNEGSWAVFGGVLVDHVVLTPDKLRVEGRRIFFLFPKQKLVLFEFTRLKGHKAPPFSPTMEVEINLDNPIDSADQARTILKRVFALNTSDVLKTLPDFWRVYLADHHFSYDPSQQKDAEYRWREQRAGTSEPAQYAQPDTTNDPGSTDTDEPTFRVGPDTKVKAPRAKLTSAPAYSEIAQYENFKGIAVVNVVVGTDGKVHRFRLLRPLGMGLDEIAQSTVQTWRFQPATHNGQPVAVEMNIEVAFDFY
jgi:TonB family protein